MSENPPTPESTTTHRDRLPWYIAGGGAIVLALMFLLYLHARGAVNDVALSSQPKGVTVIAARASSWRASRTYVGTIEPWIEAKVGPQLVSAYADTVLVRPGAVVKRGEVLATLDCRNASESSKAVEMQARALQTTQTALADQAARISQLVDGGYASQDEVEQKKAESESKQAQLAALQAQLANASLQVDDCVLRAPFDGEVATREIDPGAFVRPGQPVATLVQRDTVRVTADVPEDDFVAVAPGTPVKIRVLATGVTLSGAIARRAPAADLSTRTVHVEIDLPNADRSLPVGTTAELTLDVGRPQPATEIPLLAANVRGSKATVFVAGEDGTAHAKSFAVLGERGGSLFVEPGLAADSHVVTQGRTTLGEGDKVAAALDSSWMGEVASATTTAPASPASPATTPAAVAVKKGSGS